MQNEFKYSEEELDLIRSTFHKNKELLVTLRKAIMQGELSDKEKKGLEILKQENVAKLIRKIWLPVYDLDGVIGQGGDMWASLNLKAQIADQMTEHIVSRRLVIDFFDQQISKLEGKEVEDKIKLSDFVDSFVDINARCLIQEITEQNLSFLKVISEKDKETAEELAQRLKKNSNK